MRPIATDVARSVVCESLSVCVFVCWSHKCAVQKRLNQSRCRLGADSCGLKEPCIRWVEILPREGAILWLSCPLKNAGMLWSMQRKGLFNPQ